MVHIERYPIPPAFAILGFSEHVPRVNRKIAIESTIANRCVSEYTPFNSNYASVDRYCDIIIPPTQHLTDLSDLCVSVKGSIQKENNEAIEAEDKFLIMNNSLHSLFKSVTIYLNQTQVCNDPNYTHTSMIKNLTQFSKSDIDSAGYLIGFRDPGTFNPQEITENTLARLPEDGEALRDFYYRGKLEADIGTIDAYLISQVEIRIRLQIADSAHILGYDLSKKYSIKIDDLKIFVNHYELRRNASLALDNSMFNSQMCYPFKKHETKTFIINNNQTSVQIDAPFQNRIPQKLYIFMQHLDSERKPNLNTHYYSLFGLNRLQLSIDGVDMYNINCSEDKELYYAILKSLNKRDSVLTKKTWMNGSSIVALDLATETYDENPQNLQLNKSGNMRLKLEYKQNNNHNIAIYLMGEFTNTLNVDNNRQITIIE